MKSELETLIEELEAETCTQPEAMRTPRIEPERYGIAECGSLHCAGCYEVAPGMRIHPPKCGEDYRAWLERWESKGRVQ